MENLWLSIHKLVAAVPLSQESTHRLLHEVKLYQYRFLIKQKLKIIGWRWRGGWSIASGWISLFATT